MDINLVPNEIIPVEAALENFSSGGFGENEYTCEDCEYWTTAPYTRWCSLHEKAIEFHNKTCKDFIHE